MSTKYQEPSSEVITRDTDNPWTQVSHFDKELPHQRVKQRLTLNKQKEQDLSQVKVKTLAEIRAEKKLKESTKRERSPSPGENKSKKSKLEEDEITSTNAEVSSTSKIDEEIGRKWTRRKSVSTHEEVISKKPKLRRPQVEDNIVSSAETEKPNGVKVQSAMKVESSKIDELLLLEEDDLETTNVSLQAEEDLLKDIDDLLDD